MEYMELIPLMKTGYAIAYIWVLCKAAKTNDYTFLRRAKTTKGTVLIRSDIVRILEAEDLERIGEKWLIKAEGVRKLLKYKQDKSDKAKGRIVS